ncbi:hypothetical protein EV175_007532, partial [Coemansia sp. RSA 1933]
MIQPMMGSMQFQQPQMMDQYNNPYMSVAQQSPMVSAQQMQYSQVYMAPVPVSQQQVVYQPQYQQQQQQPMMTQVQPQQSVANHQVVYSPAYLQGQQMAE